MNPQQNDTQQGDATNPQAQGQNVQGQGVPNFDGFGGPNISYENYDDQAIQKQQQEQQQAASAIPMNVVDVVNANGVVSGRKVVDYTWQRGAVCLAVLAAGLLIGLIVSLMIVVNKDAELSDLKRQKTSLESEIAGVYGKLGVQDLAGAISQIEQTDTLNGGDLNEINGLLVGKYGSFKLDLADSNINFIRKNGVYKIVSLGIYRESGTKRAVLYEKIADGKWKLGGFDANKTDPCADSTDEEKEAIKSVIPCTAEDNKDEKK